MPIQEQNIKFLASQVMDDVPEGGGAATGNEIPDGVMNNVFEDISDLDRAMGRFNLRKLFLAVRTLSTDLFGGAKTVVTALPEDPAIGYTLFTTNDPFDTREQAANRVEAYLFKGPMWPGYLYGNHISGMRQINVLQRPDTPLPAIGKTLCLVQDEGLPSEREQYVRVTDVTVTLASFSDGQSGSLGEFERWVVNLSISDALRHNFTGHDAIRNDASINYTGKARLRDTSVADATRYYGGQYLSQGANIGDLSVRAASIFTQLVPAAQTETPLVNQSLNPELVQFIDAGARTVDVPQQAHTLARPVTVESRRINWIETLVPVPGPASLSVAYMAQGNWYTLMDDGAGVISGSDPAFGTGTVDYVTGTVSITLGALPDADTQIIYTYGSRVHYAARAGSAALNPSTVRVPFTLDHRAITTDGVTFDWIAGGAPMTATADAAGNITGDAGGKIDRVTGAGFLEVDQLPDRGSNLEISYTWAEPDDPAEPVYRTGTAATGSTITLPSAPVAGTLTLELHVLDLRRQESVPLVARGTESGDLVVPPQYADSGGQGRYRVVEEVVIGSVSGNSVTITNMDVPVQFTAWIRGGFSSTGG